MTWVQVLAVTLSDEWIIASIGVAFTAMGLAVRTLYRDLGREKEKHLEILLGLTRALEELTTEIRRRVSE